jgi:two-component system KDP operon response regulator KdpE
MSSAPLILAVDDEAGIRRLINLELSAQGFRVIAAESGEEALRLADEHRPDLVLLDIVMPDMSGLEVMRELRNRKQVPVILLTAKGSETDRVKGLEMGADDYLPKPFSPQEMSARVKAVLRRAIGSATSDNMVRAGEVEIDLHQRRVTRAGQAVSLTRTEWMLLQHLAANAGKIMLNAELLTKVWGPQYKDDLQYLRVWVSRLRHKLEAEPSEPKLIKTFAGIGYMFDSGEDVICRRRGARSRSRACAGARVARRSLPRARPALIVLFHHGQPEAELAAAL